MKRQTTCHRPGRTGNWKELLGLFSALFTFILFFARPGLSWPQGPGAEQPDEQRQVAMASQPELSPAAKAPTQEKTGEQQKNEEKGASGQEETRPRSEQTDQTQPAAGTNNKNKTLKGWLEAWKKTLELSYVVTGGNTVSSSFSLGNTLLKTPNDRDSYLLKAFFLRTNSTTISQKAVGTEDDFSLIEEKTRKLTAENYLIQAQYDHRPTGKLLTNLGFTWDRNKFAGVEGRALATAGAGIILADSNTAKVKTSAGLSLTFRKYSGQEMSSFLGLQYAFSWKQKLFDDASFETGFVFDDNLKRLSDWHSDWTTSLMAPLTKSLALKASLRLMRNNRPPEIEVPLYSPDDLETGLTVLVPRRKVDTFFTTTIVLNF